MKLATEVRTLYLVLVGIQVVTSLAGMGLLARMSPALGSVLQANEASVEASVNMLAVLAEPPSDDARQRFLAALAAAEANVTEDEERPVLRSIRARSAAALAGDAVARARVADALLSLSRINRQAMERADAEVRRLGLAGRWALAVLALLGILGSALALRQARHKLVTPIIELVSVLRARRAGDRHRRYSQERDTELGRALAQVNDLLDAADRGPAAEDGAAAKPLRVALASLLDRMGAQLVVVDEAGGLVAMSTDVLELLAARGDEVRRALRDDDATWVEARAPLATGLVLVTLRSAPVAG